MKKIKKYNSIGKEEKRAVAKVMEEGVLSDFVARKGEYFLGGKYVKELESQFRRRFKVKYAVSFNSASTALQAAVSALGIGPGDQVITSPFTMSATASAILANNALPVFADISENNFCIDPEKIEKLINKNTKAILAVNLFGTPADYDKILKIAKKHNLKVIEDNAQSPGAVYKKKLAGTIGDVGVFSFNFHKTIHAGEGGILTTNNKKYAFRAQLARNHGEVVMDDYRGQNIYEPILGNNHRLTEMQSAIILEQLKKLERLNKPRVVLADYLAKKLEKFVWLACAKTPENIKNVYYTFPIRFLEEKIGMKREIFTKAMEAKGFSLSCGYQKPLYLLPIYQKRKIYPNTKFPFVSSDFPNNVSYKKGICPVAERMYEKELLCTNICRPPQTKKDIDSFIKAIEKIEHETRKI